MLYIITKSKKKKFKLDVYKIGFIYIYVKVYDCNQLIGTSVCQHTPKIIANSVKIVFMRPYTGDC